MSAETALRTLLRIGAALLLLAFPTALLSDEAMAATHRWLGLGELVVSPIVGYLARSLSLFYGFHGVLLLVVSFDVRRLAPIVIYLGTMNVLLGIALLAVDLHAGLPAWWTWNEGPPVAAIGVVILLLERRCRRRGDG